MRRARRAGDQGELIGITVEIDALRAAAVGRSGYGETVVIGGFITVGRGGLGVALEGLESSFGGPVGAEKE